MVHFVRVGARVRITGRVSAVQFIDVYRMHSTIYRVRTKFINYIVPIYRMHLTYTFSIVFG